MTKTKFQVSRRGAMALAGAAALTSALPRSPRAADPIRLGASNPLTGAGGSYGPTMRKAIERTIAEVNAAGGVLGRQIELYGEDTQTNPDAAVRAARKLIDADKVSAIMGTWASSVTTAVAPLCWESKVFLTCVSGSDTITLLPHQGYLIRTQPNSTLQMTELGGYIGSDLGKKRVFIIGAQTPFAKPNQEKLTEVLPKHGSELIGALVYDKDKTSFRSEVDIAMKENPDIIFLNGYTPDVTVVMKDLFKAGYTGARIAPAYAVNQKLLESLPNDVTQDCYTYAPSPAVDSGAYKRLAKFLEVSDVDPYSSQCNDHAALVILSIAKAGDASGTAIRDAVRKISQGDGVEVDNVLDGLKQLAAGKEINYTGASGPCDFTDIGDISDTQFRYEIVDGGKFKTLKIG